MIDAVPPTNADPLAIIAGGGKVPLMVADAARRAGRATLIIGITGEADADIAAYPHAWIKWGEIGRVYDLLKGHGGRDVCLVGSIRKRPNFRTIKIDFGAVRSLPDILSILIGGDDTVLRRAVRVFESYGFRIVGAHQIAPELVVPVGALGRVKPGRKNQLDIDRAFEAAKLIGRLDIGQAAVAVGGRVVALEGVEGTDAMLARCAALKEEGRLSWSGRSGVLVKCIKPQQDERLDMPAIGPRTVEAVIETGLAGIVVEAARVMIVDRAAAIAAADRAGVFILGKEAGPEFAAAGSRP